MLKPVTSTHRQLFEGRHAGVIAQAVATAIRQPNAQLGLGFRPEINVDLFAGGGGASTGIESGTGRPVDIAVNHDPEAIALHEANHPHTVHHVSDVFEVDPIEATEGLPVGLLWASPDCRHFSPAKGGAPVSKSVRSLADVVIKWAAVVRPRLLITENVPAFKTWGPLLKNGRPCKRRAGQDFRRWVGELQALGYTIEWCELAACDFGAPTIRNRLYIVARRDGIPIRWPKPTHGPVADIKKGIKAYLTAADCIDFTEPVHSIFMDTQAGKAIGIKRPLVDATLRRIAKGVHRFVLTADNPYIVPPERLAERGQVGEEAAWLSKHRTGSVGASLNDPFPTVTSNGFSKRPGGNPPIAMTAAHFEQANAGFYTGDGRSLHDPSGTVCARGSMQRLVISSFADMAPATAKAKGSDTRAFLIKFYGQGGQLAAANSPMHTIPTKHRMGWVEQVFIPVGAIDAEVIRRARQCADFLHQYLPERFPESVDMIMLGDRILVDVGMRMLTPRELYRAQGFGDDYQISIEAPNKRGQMRPLPKDAQVRMCGNSVCPHVSRALVMANCREVIATEQQQLPKAA